MADVDPTEPVKDVEAVDAKDAKSRNDRPTGSTHFGDKDFYEETTDEIGDATWGEVFQACCVHDASEWGMIFVGLVAVCFFLYFFLLGLDLLGGSAKIIGGCTAGALFGDDTNPIGGLMIGILATVLVQSSSTTTSIVVSLVGADAVGVKAAIYMVMGANIGTSVTNTIVAMGQMGDGDQLERAFSGATVHDMFNFMTVGVLLPVELITGYLYYLTKAMVEDATVRDDDKWEGPLKKIVSPLTKKIIIANKNVIKYMATGEDKSGNPVDSCDQFYPATCDGSVNYKNCKMGLISCDKDTGDCPAFFSDGATQKDDEVSGGVVLFLSLVLLTVCLIGLITVLQKLLLGMSTRVIYKATNLPGLLSICVGCGITILVQSSSITTSTLTPLVGMGVIQLEDMLPLTLGANIGTTFTGLMAALVSNKIDALQVALAHLFFNITGILIFYPIPFMRKIPLHAARQLGKATRIFRLFPVVYILTVFIAFPALLLGLSSLFEQDQKGFTVLGSFITAIVGCAVIYAIYWYNYKDGQSQLFEMMTKRNKRSETFRDLPSDMDYLKAEVEKLKAHTGLEDEVEAKEVAEEKPEVVTGEAS